MKFIPEMPRSIGPLVPTRLTSGTLRSARATALIATCVMLSCGRPSRNLMTFGSSTVNRTVTWEGEGEGAMAVSS
jgi:hypothetical protein